MTAAVRVLMNEKSGSCDGRREEIEAAFLALGVTCEVSPLREEQTLAALKIKPGTVLAAAGGDGTMNAVAAMLVGSETCMGVLGLGTLNHFAKDLGLPLDLAEAVQVIVSGQPKSVDMGEVNGQIFVNNSSLGFYPGMVVERERMKKSGRNKWLSLVIASARGFVRFHQLSVSLTLPPEAEGGPSRRIERRTPFLFVGNNEYAMQGAAAGTRVCLDGGKLHLVLAPGATRWSLLKLTIAMLRHKVQEAENFESFCVEEFTVGVTRRVSRVSLDGELRRLAGPLHYRVRAGALHVMVPAEVRA